MYYCLYEAIHVLMSVRSYTCIIVCNEAIHVLLSVRSYTCIIVCNEAIHVLLSVQRASLQTIIHV
jgi:hypothetical protein